MARVTFAAAIAAAAVALTVANGDEEIPGPTNLSPRGTAAWLKNQTAYREQTLSQLNYTGSIYNVPQLKWTQTAYIQPQMHPYDQYFFDAATQQYTVDRFLDDLNARYGGIDAMLMWPTYTNIGVDDRSQYDLFEVMPGGIAAIKNVTDQLHARGVKVLIPYNPWDHGTRRDAQGRPDEAVLANLIKAMGADGFNGDTMGGIPETFYTNSTIIDYPIALEPEGGGGNGATGSKGLPNSISWDTMGWGYWQYPKVPSVDRWKWLDSRRMTNICERWSKNHTDALQHALFNGIGFESWENVWGTWNGITPRDGEAIRRVATLLRFLGGRGYLQSPGWIPHDPTLASGVLFASRWPMAKDGTVAWTVVNRGGVNYTGPALTLPKGAPAHCYDLYRGVEIAPQAGVLHLAVEWGGFGAVLCTGTPPASDAGLAKVMATMAGLTKTPLEFYTATWEFLQQRRVSVGTAPAANPLPEGMVAVPGGPFRFAVSGVMIEGYDDALYNNVYGVDVQHPFEPHPRRYHVQFVNMRPFAIDRYPVTQGDFAGYLAANFNAIPADTFNYLKNWDWSNPGGPKPHAGNEQLPVTYLGLDEARAFCKWAGKRLPGEIEWQYAAQGGETDRAYPWGSVANQSLFPVQQTTGKNCKVCVYNGPEPVGKYGDAALSPFGVGDLVGGVWQYTDEFGDAHTRSVILRGGSNFRPYSSNWYFPNPCSSGTGTCPGGVQLTQHNKYFLMNARYERAGTVSFRCAADMPPPPPCSSPVCVSFDAPVAFTDVSALGAKDWLVPVAGDRGETVMARKQTGKPPLISKVTGTGAFGPCGDTTQLPHGYPATGNSPGVSRFNVLLSWTGGAGCSNCTSAANATGQPQCAGGGSVVFSVGVSGSGVLTVVGGAYAASPVLNATLVGGGGSSHVGGGGSGGAITQVMTLNASQSDVDGNDGPVYHTIAWEVRFDAAGDADAELHVTLSTAVPPVPPTPPPPPPPPPLPKCGKPMCGTVQETSGDVSLTAAGAAGDWAHWGIGTSDKHPVQRKAGVKQRLVSDAVGLGKTLTTYNNNPTTFSWTDGTPQRTQTATPTGVTNNAGVAVNVTVPETTNGSVTAVRVWLGEYDHNTPEPFSAVLLSSDGKQLGAFSDTTTMKGGGIRNFVVELAVPASSGSGERTLAMQLLQGKDGPKGNANIEFCSVAVTVEGAPLDDAPALAQPMRGGPPQSGAFLQAVALA